MNPMTIDMPAEHRMAMDIHKLFRHAFEEFHDAQTYIKCAGMHKVDSAKLHTMFCELAQQEHDHGVKLHTMAIAHMEELKKLMTVPDALMYIWNSEIEMLMERAGIVKYEIETCKK